MNVLDLFSGIGGFSLGLEQAGIKPNWVGYSDIDKYANEVYKRRFPNAKRLGPVEDVLEKIDKLPKIDLVTFGFPCQDLSIAGKRKGLKGSRSGLFFKTIEIIKLTKPKYFIFENVKGIFSSNKGKDFTIILQTIADIGYDGQWQLLNTRWFLPQNRERVYFVGHIRGECRPKVFPIGEDEGQVKNKNLNQIGTIGDKDSEATRVYSTDGLARTIKGGGGMGSKTGLYEVKMVKVHSTQSRNPNRPSLTKICECGSKKLYQKCCGVPGGTGYLNKNDGTTYCLDGANSQAVENTHNIRRLTPIETERLQGFPDNWTEGCSDTQRYKQTGNAVSVPVVKSIMEKLYCLKE